MNLTIEVFQKCVRPFCLHIEALHLAKLTNFSNNLIIYSLRQKDFLKMTANF